MYADQVREEQRNFGRSQQEGTLHVRSGFNRSGASKRPAAKASPKGHEAFLKALEASGATVQFEKASSGEKIVGTIKTSDKFTVSVANGEGQTRVLFKHDISEFVALTGPKKADDTSPADHESVE